MSSSRKPKIEKAEKKIYSVKEPRKSVEKALIGTVIRQTSYVYSEDVIPRLNYPIESLKNLVGTNGYVTLCINKRVESTVGKGFNELDDPEENLFPTDPWIIENIDVKELKKTEKSALIYGEFFWDVPIFQGKPQTIYSVPVSTMLKGTGKRDGEYVQYYGIKGKEKWYPALNLKDLKKGRVKTGNYIYHWKEGEEAYGVPEWIAGQMEIMTSKEQRRTILSYFLNDCDPERITVHYGLSGITEQQIDDYISKREKYTQGSEKAGRSDNIFRNETQTEIGKAVEVIEIKKEIITAIGLQLGQYNKQDICAFFSTPGFLVNLPSSKASLSSDEIQYAFHFFINDIIQPAQRQRYYETFSVFFPNMGVQLNTITMPKLTQKENNDVTIEATKAERIVDRIIEKAMKDNDELRILEKQ